MLYHLYASYILSSPCCAVSSVCKLSSVFSLLCCIICMQVIFCLLLVVLYHLCVNYLLSSPCCVVSSVCKLSSVFSLLCWFICVQIIFCLLLVVLYHLCANYLLSSPCCAVHSWCNGLLDWSLMVDPLSYFSFQPVLHNCNKGCGLCYPVCEMVHNKEPLLLIGKSSPCGSSGFPLLLFEWSFTICLMPYNCVECVIK